MTLALCCVLPVAGASGIASHAAAAERNARRWRCWPKDEERQGWLLIRTFFDESECPLRQLLHAQRGACPGAGPSAAAAGAAGSQAEVASRVGCSEKATAEGDVLLLLVQTTPDADARGQRAAAPAPERLPRSNRGSIAGRFAAMRALFAARGRVRGESAATSGWVAGGPTPRLTRRRPGRHRWRLFGRGLCSGALATRGSLPVMLRGHRACSFVVSGPAASALFRRPGCKTGPTSCKGRPSALERLGWRATDYNGVAPLCALSICGWAWAQRSPLKALVVNATAG